MDQMIMVSDELAYPMKFIASLFSLEFSRSAKSTNVNLRLK